MLISLNQDYTFLHTHELHIKIGLPTMKTLDK